MEEIRDEEKSKVTEQINKVQFILKNVCVLLTNLFKGGKTSGPFHKTTKETMRVLQVIQRFTLGDFEFQTETDSEIDRDSKQSLSTDEGNMKRTDRDWGIKPKDTYISRFGKVDPEQRKGRSLYHPKTNI